MYNMNTPRGIFHRSLTCLFLNTDAIIAATSMNISKVPTTILSTYARNATAQTSSEYSVRLQPVFRTALANLVVLQVVAQPVLVRLLEGNGVD